MDVPMNELGRRVRLSPSGSSSFLCQETWHLGGQSGNSHLSTNIANLFTNIANIASLFANESSLFSNCPVPPRRPPATACAATCTAVVHKRRGAPSS